MAAGDETVIGPYPNNASGVASSAAEMNTAWDGTDDKYVVINASNGLQHWIIHIEGQ